MTLGELVVGIIVGLAAAWLLLLALLFVLRPRGVGAAAVIGVVPDVLRLARSLVADPTVPASVRASLVFLGAWLLSPIDLIPEFVPVLGPIDDVIVTVLILRWVRSRLGETELRQRWPGSSEGYEVLVRVIGAGP